MPSLTSRHVARGLRDFEQGVNGTRLPALRAAGRALAAGIRAELRHASSHPSKPGEPPAKHTGTLATSIRTGVVENALRVGSGNFVARILEFGTIAGGFITPAPGRRHRRTGRKARQGPPPKPRKPLVIAPRPFMARGLARAKAKMGEGIVAELRRKGHADLLAAVSTSSES